MSSNNCFEFKITERPIGYECEADYQCAGSVYEDNRKTECC